MKKSNKQIEAELLAAMSPEAIPEDLPTEARLELSLLQSEYLRECVSEILRKPNMRKELLDTLKKNGWAE